MEMQEIWKIQYMYILEGDKINKIYKNSKVKTIHSTHTVSNKIKYSKNSNVTIKNK